MEYNKLLPSVERLRLIHITPLLKGNLQRVRRASNTPPSSIDHMSVDHRSLHVTLAQGFLARSNSVANSEEASGRDGGGLTIGQQVPCRNARTG
jgi:hypothetical protein